MHEWSGLDLIALNMTTQMSLERTLIFINGKDSN